MNERIASLSGLRFGVFGKGGSGKSTVSVLLARSLARREGGAILLDSDSTNVGLHHALGIETPPEPLLEYFGGPVFTGGRVTCPVDDPLLLPGAEIDLASFPTQYTGVTRDGIVLLTAGKIGEAGPGSGCDGPIAKIVRDVSFRSGTERPPVVADFKAGFEDSARGVLVGLDWAFVVVDPSHAALRAAVDMLSMIRAIRNGAKPATKHLGSPELVEFANRLYSTATIAGADIILNKVPDDETERYMRQALAESGIIPIGAFRVESAIARAWLHGKEVTCARAQLAMDAIVSRLETEMGSRQLAPVTG